eukprot:366458-Chlamydomonas_euryale.AAC.9
MSSAGGAHACRCGMRPSAVTILRPATDPIPAHIHPYLSTPPHTFAAMKSQVARAAAARPPNGDGPALGEQPTPPLPPPVATPAKCRASSSC